MPEPSSYPVRLDTQEPPPLTFSRWVAGVVLRWRLAIATGLVVLALAALSLVLIPPSYRSTASFVANSSTASRISAGGALGGSMLGGLASQLGITATTDPSESPAFYDRLLHSRELLTRVLLSRFPDPRPNTRADSVTLLTLMNPPGKDARRKTEAGVKLLDKAIVTEFDNKTNIVSLRYDSRWPDLSAAVVNRAVALVSDFNREQRTETIRSKRLFLEDRLTQARTDLERAEDGLRFFYEENRARMSPTLAFREQQLQRRVDVASDLYLALQREYDSARLNEFNSAALVTVLDSGIPARKPQWPRYGLLFATALLVGGIAGLAVAGGASVVDDWRRRNPDVATSFRDALIRARREIGSTLRRGRISSARERRVA